MRDASYAAAERIIEDCRTIARCSEEAGRITRTFLSHAMVEVHAILRGLMEQAGMTVCLDAMGNLRGRYRGLLRDGEVGVLPRLLVGSHVDTVPDAGAFDGVLGVVLGIYLVQALKGRRLACDVEVAAFSEEEGVRFGVPFLGSRALIGDVDGELLECRDRAGGTLEQAIRDFGLEPDAMAQAVVGPEVFAYVEFHIEQGPVLDSLGKASSERMLGIVEAIVGQTRLKLTFLGEANHAGTTPMKMRRDALAGAAEWILSVETLAQRVEGMVATVGEIAASPGAVNVVPGEVAVSLDLRHAKDAVREEAVGELISSAEQIAGGRGLRVESRVLVDQRAVKMNASLVGQLETAVTETGSIAHRMDSGAGHDAMVLAAKVPAAMLFVRSPGGVSHHPDERVLVEDVGAAFEAGLYFLDHLQLAGLKGHW